MSLSSAFWTKLEKHELPEVSATLKTPNSPGHAWLQATAELSALCRGLFSVLHPEQCCLGHEALARLDCHSIRDPENLPRAMEYWTSPFSGISVISNRETPIHRDTGGRNSWYDLLLTLGNYELGRFEVPGIGLRLAYDPGTIVAVAGKTIAHGVSPCEGDRVCIAYFMRDGVHEQLGIRAGGWMNINYYK